MIITIIIIIIIYTTFFILWLSIMHICHALCLRIYTHPQVLHVVYTNYNLLCSEEKCILVTA